MESHGVDLSSLGGPGFHQSQRMPFHGDEQFPVSGYDGGHPGPQRQDSSASLLFHPHASTSPSQSGRPGPPPPYASYLGPPNDRSRRSKIRLCTWPPRWHSSWNMYVFFLFGLACAIGHHVFYSVLDGQPANAQIQMLRYGTFLAFAAKAGLSASVIAAFRQRVWTTVRTRMMSVAAIDAMFASAEDFFALVNWEFVSGAKIAAALVLFVWLTPLVVILTANTLLVELQTTETNTTCPGIRTLNFAFEDANDWRTPLKIDGLFEIPLSLWNTTKPQGEDPPGWFDYYTAPGPTFVQTATIGAFLGQAVSRKNASLETCSPGWNCTFEVSFTAPGYKCTELASGVDSALKNLTQESGEAEPPFGTDILLPKGSFAYYAFASGGEYSTTQLKDVSPGGIPNMKPPYPKHFGAFRTEPVVWIGYAVLANPDETPPTEPSDPKWNSSFIPKIFGCEHYETNYTVHFNYTDGTQYTTVKKRTFLTPIINTTFVPHVDADDGTADNTTATPEENYVYPTDVERYRRVAAYHSLGYMLREFVNGTVEIESSLVNPIANTAALQTKLLDPRNNYFAYPNLMSLIQGFYEDLILSIFSNPQFVEVVWAAQTGEQTGTLAEGGGRRNHSDYAYPCTRSRTANLYSFHARDLWIVYGIAVLLAVLGLVAGALALHENGGVVRNTRFSSIVAATRGPPLEKVNWEGPGQDRGDVPNDVRRLRIGYGKVGLDVQNTPTSYDTRYPGQEPAGGVKCGFGLEGDVNQNRREGSLFHR